jgi:hypothetical protein
MRSSNLSGAMWRMLGPAPGRLQNGCSARLRVEGGFDSHPVRHVLQTSTFWFIVFIVVAVIGAVAQYQSTRAWEVETYNRLGEMCSSMTSGSPRPARSAAP